MYSAVGVNKRSLTVPKVLKVKFEVSNDQIAIIKLVHDKLSKSYEPDLLSLSLKLAGVVKALDAQVLSTEDSHAAIMAAIRQKKTEQSQVSDSGLAIPIDREGAKRKQSVFARRLGEHIQRLSRQFGLSLRGLHCII